MMKVNEIKEKLESLGIEIPPNAKKADLEQLLRDVSEDTTEEDAEEDKKQEQEEKELGNKGFVEYTVKNCFKLGGKFYQKGIKVTLSEEEIAKLLEQDLLF